MSVENSDQKIIPVESGFVLEPDLIKLLIKDAEGKQYAIINKVSSTHVTISVCDAKKKSYRLSLFEDLIAATFKQGVFLYFDEKGKLTGIQAGSATDTQARPQGSASKIQSAY